MQHATGDPLRFHSEPDRIVAEHAGQRVGSGTMTWWDEADGTRLYLLTGHIEDGHQCRGFGRRLLAAQEEHARAHAQQHMAAGIGMFGANVTSPEQQRLIESAGYTVAFTRVRMTMPLTDHASCTPELAMGIEVRPASEDDHRAVFDLVSAVFGAGSPGYVQTSFDEFDADLRADTANPELWTLTWAGEDLVGLVVSGVDDTPWVAVHPRWRRRGLATALLARNHQQLRACGIGLASLWTVLENPTGSVALYERVGYSIVEAQPRYRKPI